MRSDCIVMFREIWSQIYLWGTFVRTPCMQYLWFYHEITSQIRHNEIFLTTQKQFSPWSFWNLSVCWKHHKIRCILIPSLRPRDFLTSEARSFKSVFSNKIGDNTAALLRKKTHVLCMKAAFLLETKKYFYPYLWHPQVHYQCNGQQPDLHAQPSDTSWNLLQTSRWVAATSKFTGTVTSKSSLPGNEKTENVSKRIRKNGREPLRTKCWWVGVTKGLKL